MLHVGRAISITAVKCDLAEHLETVRKMITLQCSDRAVQ